MDTRSPFLFAWLNPPEPGTNPRMRLFALRAVVRSNVSAGVAAHLRSFSAWNDMHELVEKEIERAKEGGGAKAIERHVKKNGKILVRDRLKLLLDPGTSLLELSPLAGYQMYSKEGIAAAGIIVRTSKVYVAFFKSIDSPLCFFVVCSDWCRPSVWSAMHGGRERRHSQGRGFISFKSVCSIVATFGASMPSISVLVLTEVCFLRRQEAFTRAGDCHQK